MDSFTHALIIAILLSLIGRPDLAAYGVLGAVLIDLDILFSLFSDKDPRLYIFTHGGFTHSFFGAFTMALLISMPTFLLSGLKPFDDLLPSFGLPALAAIAMGALTHISADYLAYPGIPLLYPMSDKKHTLGIFGGPNLLIMLASVAYIAFMSAGLASIEQPWLYVATFLLILAFCTGAKACAALKTKGHTIATPNPFKWLVVENSPEAYRFYDNGAVGRRRPTGFSRGMNPPLVLSRCPVC